MRYGQMRKFDVANGEGIRTNLFVTGCSHHCPDCFNEEYQDFQAGILWDEKAEEELFSYINNPHSVGLTLLGGEPMQNTEGLIPIARRMKEETDKTLWIYSGYTLDKIKEHEDMMELLSYADVLVDGRFEKDLKDLTLRFRGSSNQRVIDVPKTLEKGEVVLYIE